MMLLRDALKITFETQPMLIGGVNICWKFSRCPVRHFSLQSLLQVSMTPRKYMQNLVACFSQQPSCIL